MKIISSDKYRAGLCFVTGPYRTDDPDLAKRFVNSAETATADVQADLLFWRIIEGRVRRFLVRRFPYITYYLARTSCSRSAPCFTLRDILTATAPKTS